MKKIISIVMMMVSLTAMAQETNVFMFEPTMNLNFYYHEDITTAVNKLKRAFKIKSEPTKVEGSLVFKQKPLLQSMDVHYIVCPNEKNNKLLETVAIILIGNTSNYLNRLIDIYEEQFYKSGLYEYDGKTYTNGVINVYFQKSVEGQTDYATIMILPKIQ